LFVVPTAISIFVSPNQNNTQTHIKLNNMKKIITLAVAFICFSVAANAQATASATQSVGLALTNAIAITFTGSGTATGTAVSLPFATVADYANGVTSATQTLKVQSNKAFNVTVAASAANFTYSGTTSPAPVMPVTNLNLMVTANSTGGTIGSAFTAFGDLTSVAQTVLTGCTYGSNQTFGVQYQATPGYAFPAGTYTASIVYTATQP
jgi:hypothetical protein